MGRAYFLESDLLCDAVKFRKWLPAIRRNVLALFSGQKDGTMGANRNLARQNYFRF